MQRVGDGVFKVEKRARLTINNETISALNEVYRHREVFDCNEMKQDKT